MTKQTQPTPRESFLEVAQRELDEFERRERAFLKQERRERALAFQVLRDKPDIQN
jgi:hypothetical protein